MPIPDIWVRRCRVISVTDGDTVRVHIDDGRRHYSEEAIRLLDVDAAEVFSGTPEQRAIGQQHKTILSDWVAMHNNSLIEWPFYVRTFKDRQTFNRYVGEIWCEDGHSMNEYMRATVGVVYQTQGGQNERA